MCSGHICGIGDIEYHKNKGNHYGFPLIFIKALQSDLP